MTKGDLVQITTPFGVYQGKILTAANYGTEDEPNWYIELGNDESNCGPYDDQQRRSLSIKRPKYTYWKQKVDGGTVHVLS